MTQPAVRARTPLRADVEACYALTDRFAAQLAAVAAHAAPPALAAEGDIEALAFTVMIEASKSAREDLKSVMAGVKAINAAKAALRKRLHPGKAGARPRGAAIDVETVLQLALTLHVAEVTAEIDAMCESQGEMGEMESLRLQMAMDRMSKMMTTLSNLLGKIADTQSTIARNLK